MKHLIPTLSLLFLVSCTCGPGKNTGPSGPAIAADPYLESLLSRAIDDALVAEESEQYSIYVIPDSILKDTLKQKYVKGVTWLNKKHEPGWREALSKKDKQYKLPRGVAIWITVIPQVKEFCNTQVFENAEQLRLRLKQKLGLDYKVEYTSLAEVWVPISHLKRPCLDPNMNNAICMVAADVKIDSGHSIWFFKQRLDMTEPGAVPFTGLGYTYDWGSADSEIGFTEFVFISDGKEPLLIKGLYAPEDYCTMTI